MPRHIMSVIRTAANKLCCLTDCKFDVGYTHEPIRVWFCVTQTVTRWRWRQTDNKVACSNLMAYRLVSIVSRRFIEALVK